MHDLADLDAIDWARPVNWSWPLNRGLVSWYSAVPGPGRAGWKSNRWRDLCGRNHGTLTNMDPATDWVGPRGRPGGFGALDFDGSDDLASAASFPFLSPPFALSCWFRPFTTGDAKYCSFIARGAAFENNSNYAFGWRRDASRIFCYWRNGATLYGSESAGSAAPAGTWCHAVAVLDSSSNLSVYKNGVLLFSDGSNSAPTDGSQPLTIGKPNSTTSTDLAFNGMLDDVRIYNRALSAAEVQQLYNESCMGYPNGLARIATPYGYAQEAAPAGDDINDPFGLSGFFGAAA